MDAVAEYLFEYLRDVLYDPARAKIDTTALPEGFVELGQGMEFFAECVAETRAFAKFLAQGELSCPLPSIENEVAAPLRALHSTLKHMTWQAEQVAKGDYCQHIDYLGGFATAFNAMTKQLEQRQTALKQEIERSRQKTRALEQSNDFFEIIARDSAKWVAIVDRETGELLFSNFPALNILADGDFVAPLKRWISARVSEMENEQTSRTVEFELSDNGIAQYFSAMVRPLVWRERAAVAFALTDITAEHEHLREKENTAYRDSLTRQYNRHHGMRLLSQWVEERRSFMLCFADIDNLKYVNDKFGQAEGNKYILSVTAVLRGFSPDITICRLGGDEFMLLAEGWDENRANEHLESLRTRLRKRDDDPDSLYFHTMSYGVVVVDEMNEASPSELLARADEKMTEYQRAHKLERVSAGEIPEDDE
ncbi:MAG: diguanylate cyclase [Oscillospiraceae bacterium]|jgi:diguanylate cyclase (GGDEF)-like protein|nr:diguanylate cyclase [Oscillospiraceae bacterium]